MTCIGMKLHLPAGQAVAWSHGKNRMVSSIFIVLGLLRQIPDLDAIENLLGFVNGFLQTKYSHPI